LKNFMPVVLCKVYNNWDEHGERLIFVSFENSEEIVIFEETHRSIRDLEVSTANAPDNSSEEWSDEWLYLINFTHF